MWITFQSRYKVNAIIIKHASHKINMCNNSIIVNIIKIENCVVPSYLKYNYNYLSFVFTITIKRKCHYSTKFYDHHDEQIYYFLWSSWWTDLLFFMIIMMNRFNLNYLWIIFQSRYKVNAIIIKHASHKINMFNNWINVNNHSN